MTKEWDKRVDDEDNDDKKMLEWCVTHPDLV